MGSPCGQTIGQARAIICTMASERLAVDRAAQRPSAHGVRLLVVDPEFGVELRREELSQAREQVVLPSLDLDAGPLKVDELDRANGVRGEVHGFLVISGTLTINLRIYGRRCTRLVGALEVVLLDGLEADTMPVSWDWTVLDPVRLAIFDDRLLLFARRWPRLMGTFLKRAAQQPRQAFLQQAISQLPRVEERLLALFWSIADRQGVVRADGVWVELSTTHETLAHMVGAQRPTVSLGLTRLSDSGLLRAQSGGWLLNPESLNSFDPSTAGSGTEPLAGESGSPSALEALAELAPDSP